MQHEISVEKRITVVLLDLDAADAASRYRSPVTGTQVLFTR
jgi:hypothetical protein